MAAPIWFTGRFLGGPHRVLLFWHYVANRFITLLSNIISDLNLSDMETGMKAFARKLMQLRLSADRFTLSPRSLRKRRGPDGESTKFRFRTGPHLR